MISQAHATTEELRECLAEQVREVLLQVLVHKGTGYMEKQRILSLVVFLEYERLEPRIILLLRDILANERKRFVPKSFRTCFHYDLFI